MKGRGEANAGEGERCAAVAVGSGHPALPPVKGRGEAGANKGRGALPSWPSDLASLRCHWPDSSALCCHWWKMRHCSGRYGPRCPAATADSKRGCVTLGRDGAPGHAPSEVRRGVVGGKEGGSSRPSEGEGGSATLVGRERVRVRSGNPNSAIYILSTVSGQLWAI